ncbi:UNVERIFIED_CONTAM: hypothetical protein Sradi_6591500 [Sesamum radiatum]|uniref:Uncharacterized protein n=1 Tax=Sesamum radiatum TaxID=300843 RepID=A0AAW2JZ88_SESRA
MDPSTTVSLPYGSPRPSSFARAPPRPPPMVCYGMFGRTSLDTPPSSDNPTSLSPLCSRTPSPTFTPASTQST